MDRNYSKIYCTILLITGMLLPSIAFSDGTADTQRLARYLSLVIRDKPMSITEAKSLYNSETSVNALIDTWLASEDHQVRVQRFFQDRVGVNDQHFLINEELILFKDADNGHPDIK